MRKLINVICSLLAFCCCAQQPRFTSYSSEEFDAILNYYVSVQLVDVRRADEYAAGHIDNAIMINVLENDFMAKAKSMLDKSRPVAVYCRSGKRSKDAAKKLAGAGFVVYDLDKGYLEWVEYKK